MLCYSRTIIILRRNLVLYSICKSQDYSFTDEDLKKNNLAKTFGGSFVLSLISAFILAFFIGTESDSGFGAFAGFMVGIWIACSFGINYLFEMKSLKLFLINALYNVISFTVMGLIIGAWL